MNATKSAEKLLFETPAIKINRKGLFPGSGMLNTLIHLTSHCYFTNEGTVNYTGLMIEPVTGEYECDFYGLGFLIDECNGSKKNEKVIDSIDLLLKNSLIEIDCNKNNGRYYNQRPNETIRFKLKDTLKQQFFAEVKHDPRMSASTKKGYFFVSRNLYEILPEEYSLSDTDVLWDICTSICYNDKKYSETLNNTAIAVFIDRNDGEGHSLYTYEELAQRWHWSNKSRVFKFFKKYNSFFETRKKGRQTQIVIKDTLLYSGLYQGFSLQEENSSLSDYIIEKKIFRKDKITKKDLFWSIWEIAKKTEDFPIQKNEKTQEYLELKKEIEKLKKESSQLKEENTKLKKENDKLKERINSGPDVHKKNDESPLWLQDAQNEDNWNF